MVAVIGRKHSGKTTLTVRLCAELHRRGHRVMTIKHGSHTFNIDPSTTDTYRHYHEGQAERVAMAAPDKFALIVRWGEEEGPEAIAARHMSDADIVVCEGFKQSRLPKIEIFRQSAHATPLYEATAPAAGDYVAIVADGEVPSAGVPVIRLDEATWVATLADLVERRIMNLGQA
jgi:molybdopterin-guanine dinucleotide biosynthesis protein B